MTEREIQTAAVKALRALGSTVFVQSDRRRAVVRGTPDVFASLPGRVPMRYVGIEIKSPSGKLTKEQIAEEKLGAICVCRSVNDVLRACGYDVKDGV